MWQLSAAPYLVTLPYKGSWRQMKKELLEKDILQWSIWWMNNAPYLVILPYKGFDKYDSFNQRKAVQLMWPFWNPCVFIDSCILSLATRDCGTEASYYRYLDNTTGMFSFLSCQFIFPSYSRFKVSKPHTFRFPFHVPLAVGLLTIDFTNNTVEGKSDQIIENNFNVIQMFPILVLLWYPHKEINNSHLLFILVTMKWQWQYNLSISIGPVLEMCSLFWSALCNVSVALLLRQ